MKNYILAFAVVIGLAACGDGTRDDGSDTTANPSDTTNLHINPALEDPNSNMADTMRMVDSARVKDTVIKDKTAVKPKQ